MRLGLGCQSRSEWQGRVWPSSSPAAVSCRNTEQRAVPWHATAIPSTAGLPEKAPHGYIRVGSDSPLAGCQGLDSTCHGCPLPHHRAPRKTVLLSPSCAAPWIIQCSRDPQAALPKQHQLLLCMYAPCCWAHVCAQGCLTETGPVGTGHCGPSYAHWQPKWVSGQALLQEVFPAGSRLWGWAGSAQPSLLEGVNGKMAQDKDCKHSRDPGSATPFSHCLPGCLDPPLPALPG